MNRPQASLTPCAGRCSTVFGDLVCRGCRRFNHEVIHWNSYTAEQHRLIWQRLDAQLDQVLIPLLPDANLIQVEQFLHAKRIRLRDDATTGRKLYHALKFCEKQSHFAEESGLNLSAQQIKPLWRLFEQRILVLASANYEWAFLRANRFYAEPSS